MLNKTQIIRHAFGGGWAPDLSPLVDVSPDQSGKVTIPYLLEAQDVIYEIDGGPHLIGGTTKVNSSAVAAGANVMGCYDYWRQGTSGAPARRRVLHAGEYVYADTDDAAFSTTLFSGLERDKVPAYSTFDDLLIISSDSTTDTPKSWDQSTAQALAGSPPRFSFSCNHKNRLWAAGVYTAPSRLYYCSNTDPEDWTTTGGSIDLDPNDGDIITGIVSHKDELWVFKGPNKGSIHRITGSSPTGSDAFARKPFVSGLGACWHNAIFRFADDIGFVSQYGSIHSLSATAAYGDFFEASLSRGFNDWMLSHLNYNRLRYIWAATSPLEGRVYITLPTDASLTNNIVLIMDYRGAPNVIRWSTVPSYKMASVAAFVDTNGVRRVLGGGNDGFLRRLNMVDRSLDGSTALSYRVHTPFMSYGESMLLKTLNSAGVNLEPKGDYNFTFGWQRDTNASQSSTIMQGGVDVLGTSSASQFTLDTSVLAGASHTYRWSELEEGGDFRAVQYKITQATANQDIEIHGITASITPSGLSTEN